MNQNGTTHMRMDIQEEIILLREAIARIETKLDAMPQCKSPGLCLNLEPRVRMLESAEDKRVGGWITLTALVAAAGTVGGIVASLFKIKQ